jgi:hypothetical protein
MGDSPRTALEVQIEREAQELKNASFVPVHQLMGTHKRCHICGQIFHEHDLKPYDTHLRNQRPRMACNNCHPQRRA